MHLRRRRPCTQAPCSLNPDPDVLSRLSDKVLGDRMYEAAELEPHAQQEVGLAGGDRVLLMSVR